MTRDIHDIAAKVIAESNRDISRLAEIIADYNPTLRLRHIPRKQRETDAEKRQPYVIVKVPNNGAPELVMYLTEAEVANPPMVLSRLFNSDHSKHAPGDVLRRIENAERAKAIWEAKQEADRVEEKMDIWKSIWNTKKNYFKHDGVKMDTHYGKVV